MDPSELRSRLQLGHASLQATAERAGADLLHIKGYAVTPGFYRADRRSTDADLLVRPEHLDRFCRALLETGWEVVTHFRSGSLFQHAMTLRHPWWGAVDLHRMFPGIQLSPEEGFARLWEVRETTEIAHLPCQVPGLLDQVLLIMVHAGRDGARGQADMDYLTRILSRADFSRIQARARELHAELALAAALGRIEEYREHPDYLVWKYLGQGGSRLDEWRARFRAARTPAQRLRTVASMVRVNRDHLALSLGHAPSRPEVLAAWARRLGRGLQELPQQLRQRRGDRG